MWFSGLLSRTSALVAAALLLGSTTLLAVVPSHHKKLVREQIEMLEDQWKQSLMSNDPAMMDKLLSDDYLGVTVNGDLVTKSQQLDRMRSHELTITSLNVSDMKIKLIGQIAIVNSLAQVDGLLDGKPLRGSFRYVRVYQRLANGQWKITSFEVTHVPHSGRHPQMAGN